MNFVVRSHFAVTSGSLRRHLAVTSKSPRIHLAATSQSPRCHFAITWSSFQRIVQVDERFAFSGASRTVAEVGHRRFLLHLVILVTDSHAALADTVRSGDATGDAMPRLLDHTVPSGDAERADLAEVLLEMEMEAKVC